VSRPAERAGPDRAAGDLAPGDVAPGDPLPTGAEAAAFDEDAQERGIAGAVLMESAGRAAADLALEYLGSSGGRDRSAHGTRVVVFAGAGKNGGDAVVAARSLAARGVPVTLLVDPRRPDPDPLLHGHLLDVRALDPEGVGEAAPSWADGASPGLVIDGLLGTGLRGAPRAPVEGWIRALASFASAHGAPVLALDLPSGVEADTGRVPGAAVRAELTVAFGAAKLGTLLHPGREHAGRIITMEIGFPPWPASAATGRLVTGAMARALYPRRPLRTHKNEAGRLLLVAGGETMGGAAVLAARAALRSGVGMLRVLCHPSHREAFHRGVPEAILPDPTDPDAVAEALAGSDALVAGPGMGLDPDTLPGSLLAGLLRQADAGNGGAASGAAAPGIVLDADALTRLARGELVLPAGRAHRILLTPHPGEATRLLEGGAREVDPVGAPLDAARQAARRWGATCLLKGTPSVVALPGEDPVRVSASGSSAFARGGMGDVLAGVAGAFLARGLSAADAAALALHLTGRAADLVGPDDALLPMDLVEALPDALAELGRPDPRTAGAHEPGSALPAVLRDLAAPR
jgi:ADP-dependent NAD(P)H-hydrate dehydratase / NAD(P)H-hydrate epimerase